MTGASTGSPPATAAFASGVEWQQETCRGGRQLVTVVNHRSGHAVYCAPEEIEAASQGAGAISSVMHELRAGRYLADCDADDSYDERIRTPIRQPGSGLVWDGADRFVRRCHDGGLHRLFRPGWVVGQVIIAVFGLVALAVVAAGTRLQLRADPSHIPVIIGLGLVAVVIHELGHALATVHYGRHVRCAGLRLHLGSPAFYVDSLDSLLLTRRQRIVQAAAGPWAEWLATTLAVGVLFILPPDGASAILLHRFVVVNTIGITINLLPFVGLDGSLLLADIVREPDLAARSREALTTIRVGQRNVWLVGYAIANAVVAALLLVTAAFFWWQLFGGLVNLAWRFGTAGAAGVICAFAMIGWPLVRGAGPAIADVRYRLTRLRTGLIFRSERRWRVEAMQAFRAIPEIGGLDVQSLGILAGRLTRISPRGGAWPPVTGHLYVRPSHRSQPLQARSGVLGDIVAADASSTESLAHIDEAIVLPAQWRSYLTPRRAN